MNTKRLYTRLTLVRLQRRRPWWERHLEDLLDVVVVLAVAFLVWLAITDDDPPSADGAATEEVRGHE